MARYFVHQPPDGSPARFWRSPGGFAGITFHYNLNLLAHAVGDIPAIPGRAELVPAQDYGFGGPRPVSVQPFAARTQGPRIGPPSALPIGPKLRAFLDDPLDGHRMDLSLPIYDEDIKLGPSGGGWLRKNNDEGGFHGGTDFDTSPRAVFEVCAAASGTVLARAGANGGRGAPLVLSHVTAAGKEFRTVYQHLDITTVPAELVAGADVRRGQFLGRAIGKPPADADHVIHLHFGVAVEGPEVTVGAVHVPKLWYFIDPWGVYDYYEHDDATYANYLPPERQAKVFESPIKGAVHTIQWRAQPVFKTIPIARSTDGYQEIARFQVRVRRGDRLGGTLPEEHDQCLVWLRDDPDFFLIPLSQASDRAAERELTALLRESFVHGKAVRLEYRYVGDLRYIMAAWVNA